MFTQPGLESILERRERIQELEDGGLLGNAEFWE